MTPEQLALMNAPYDPAGGYMGAMINAPVYGQTGGEQMYFSGPGYTSPIPLPTIPPTTQSPPIGAGQSGGENSGGQSSYGNPTAGANFAGPAQREGSAWDAVRNTASFLANPMGFAIAAMLDPRNPTPSMFGLIADALGLSGDGKGIGAYGNVGRAAIDPGVMGVPGGLGGRSDDGGIGGYGSTGRGASDPGVAGTPGGVTGRGADSSPSGSGNTGASDPSGTNGGTGNGPSDR